MFSPITRQILVSDHRDYVGKAMLVLSTITIKIGGGVLKHLNIGERERENRQRQRNRQTERQRQRIYYFILKV